MSNLSRFLNNPTPLHVDEYTFAENPRADIEAELIRYLDFPARVQHALLLRQMEREEECRRRAHTLKIAEMQRERLALEEAPRKVKTKEG